MAEAMRIGIVGAKFAARFHWEGLRRVYGVPLEVVAERMGTNRNALYKLLHDARRKLRTQLEAQGLSLDYVMHLFGE